MGDWLEELPQQPHEGRNKQPGELHQYKLEPIAPGRSGSRWFHAVCRHLPLRFAFVYDEQPLRSRAARLILTEQAALPSPFTNPACQRLRNSSSRAYSAVVNGVGCSVLGRRPNSNRWSWSPPPIGSERTARTVAASSSIGCRYRPSDQTSGATATSVAPIASVDCTS